MTCNPDTRIQIDRRGEPSCIGLVDAYIDFDS